MPILKRGCQWLSLITYDFLSDLSVRLLPTPDGGQTTWSPRMLYPAKLLPVWPFILLNCVLMAINHEWRVNGCIQGG